MALEDLAAWFDRAARHFRPSDVFYPSLPGVIWMAARHAMTFRTADRGPEELSRWDADFVSVMMDLTRVIGRFYFRSELQGTEHVLQEGGCLLVGNHNGGILPFDSGLTLQAIWDRYGAARPVYSLSHDILHAVPRVRELVRKLGVLRAGHGGAERALRAGHAVLVYPGSDYDSCRPFWRRNEIELGGRTGFLKLALRTGVPIVPVVSVGTHEQLIILTRGDTLAKLMFSDALFRVKVFPIALGVPWGLFPAWFPYFPLPAQTTVRFGPPLRFDDVDPADADDPEVLARCLERVRAALQTELDVLSRDRTPWLG